MWALEKIRLQALLLRVLSMSTSQMSSPSRTSDHLQVNMLELWQPEWDVYPHNNPYIGSFHSRMIVFHILVGEETVISPLHISRSNMTRTFSFFFFSFFLFLLKGGDLLCDELPYDIFCFFSSDFVEARKRYFTAGSRKMLFEDIILSFGCDYLREINGFGKLCIF